MVDFPDPGEVFAGRYQIQALIGSGGFARVYRATQSGLGRDVALKVLAPRLRGDLPDSDQQDFLDKLSARFLREAQTISRLSSPHTIRVYDYGQAEGGLLFMALEFIDGLNLSQVSAKEGKLSPERVEPILRQILVSLGEAHGQGILHRDIKPLNIMLFEQLGEPDKVKLLDFGIAKVIAPEQKVTELTEAGMIIGTARYMAPEQILGEEIGPWTDIYSLGLVAYELLTGVAAIRDSDSIRVIGRQLAPESFSLPTSLEIPTALRRTIDRMLLKPVEARLASTEAVLSALDAPIYDDATDIEHIEALSVEALLAAGQAELIEPRVPSMPLPPPPPRRLGRAGAVVAFLLGSLLTSSLVIGALWVANSAPEPPAPRPAPSRVEVAAPQEDGGVATSAPDIEPERVEVPPPPYDINLGVPSPKPRRKASRQKPGADKTRPDKPVIVPLDLESP